MNIGWDCLSAEQRRALLALARGTQSLKTEVAEQLRNLGLAELTASGLVISTVGRTLAPVALSRRATTSLRGISVLMSAPLSVPFVFMKLPQGSKPMARARHASLPRVG